MKPTYLDAGKLAWYPDIACPVCGGDVNSWDKRCSRALGYRQIVCEGCISEEYQVTVENLRYVMENHFGLVPCPGIAAPQQTADKAEKTVLFQLPMPLNRSAVHSFGKLCRTTHPWRLPEEPLSIAPAEKLFSTHFSQGLSYFIHPFLCFFQYIEGFQALQ